MTDYNNKMAMLVLSCDKYKYAWDDFFNLRDKFWPDCPYKWYVVTETEEYYRNKVVVIKCGKEMNWTGRFKHAAEVANAKYLGVYLEDFFIEQKIDNGIINEELKLMEDNDVSMINVGDVFSWITKQPNTERLTESHIIIPRHLRYGISASLSIWRTSFLIEYIGENDCSAWDFEMNSCKIADSEKGLPGLLLCDVRQPLHPSKVPVIVQGKLYPPCIKHFKRRGYSIEASKYIIMTPQEMWRYNVKHYLAKLPFGKRFMKWIARKVFGYKFFSDVIEK